MKDDFDKIIDLFSLDAEEKEKRLDEIFRLSVEFIEKYKHVQHEGSDEDKEAITKKLNILKEKISIESKASEEALSLSKKEIQELSNEEKNFTPEQWELLQKTKRALSSEKKKIETKKRAAIDKHIKKVNPAKKRRKSRRGGSSWLKS
ncbi:MAG: hypothetical protein S4CHLAM20_07430 [Chlamydiia bacterium]|nr:hypothetical protein [Chlamydiia bacterium]